MVGRIRGYLIVGLVCLTLTAVTGIAMFADLDRPWSVTRLWVDEHVPVLSRTGGRQEPKAWLSQPGQVRFFAGAAFRAVKSGKARPGDVLDLGRLYYRARSDGHLDAKEFGHLVALAQKTGILDELMKGTPNPTATIGEGFNNGGNGVKPAWGGKNPADQFQGLLTAFEQARADGRVETGEMLRLIEQARASGVEGQLAMMLPDEPDQTRAREIARNLFSAVAGGELSVSQLSPLIQMFTQAQADGRLDKQEIDRLMKTAESLERGVRD